MRRRTALASAIFLVTAVAPRADAAPYMPSCSSGVLAPQLCTFAASSVVAAFAAPGQHLVLLPASPQAGGSDGTGSLCPDGRPSRVEHYRGVLRGTRSVEPVVLWLEACPNTYPNVRVETDRYGAPHHVEVRLTRPARAGEPASFVFMEGDHSTESAALGSIFRRDTGMSSYASGTSEECDVRASNGVCEMGQQRYAYEARVDSSISGHWARLQIAVRSESSKVQTRTSRVTAQPYGKGGWKITRVA